MYLKFPAVIMFNLVFHKAAVSAGLCYLYPIKGNLFFLEKLVDGSGGMLLISSVLLRWFLVSCIHL